MRDCAPSMRQQPSTQPLWPDRAPHACGTEPADVPTLRFYPAPADLATRAAILVLPGGGYGSLADHEGEPMAKWLNTLGISAAVLRYRHAPRYRHPVPLLDASRALRTLRAQAERWRLDGRRLGIMGASAGGHLASTLCTHFGDGNPDAADPIERVSSRPDLAILLYPVITMAGPVSHGGSRENLLGPAPQPEHLVEALSSQKQVTPRTPPTFIFHTAEDGLVPAENSLLYAMAMRAAGVPFELHVYEHGHHGVGLAQGDPVLRTWTERCAAWLARHGLARGG